MTDLVCVIPARGGSTRIPRKNIIDFMGRPLIAWSIQAALDSQLFARVLVSTDDPEIAAVAEAHGATAPFLRREYADHVSPVSLATVHALEQLAERGETYQRVVQLLPSCPIRSGDDIRSQYKLFLQRDADFQLSCVEFMWMTPWWAVHLDKAGRTRPLFPDKLQARSQDLEMLYFPSGAIWIAKVPALMQSRNFYGPDYRFAPIDWKAAVDIDVPEDVEMAEVVFQMVRKHKS